LIYKGLFGRACSLVRRPNTLQHTATRYKTLQHLLRCQTPPGGGIFWIAHPPFGSYCNTLCNTLQHTVQHTATCSFVKRPFIFLIAHGIRHSDRYTSANDPLPNKEPRLRCVCVCVRERGRVSEKVFVCVPVCVYPVCMCVRIWQFHACRPMITSSIQNQILDMTIK